MLKLKSYWTALTAVLLMTQALAAQAELPDFTKLVEAASPAVVNISTRQKVAERDRRFGIDSEQKRRTRADIPTPTVAPGADAWREGQVFQIADPTHTPHQH